MSDIAFDLLAQKINEQLHSVDAQPCLWVVDENISAATLSTIAPNENIQVMTNRSDLALVLEQKGFSVQLSDFDFTAYERHSFSHIFYRVSKEKPVVHHIINQSAHYLAADACLYISGYKNEGAKTYIDKAVKYMGGLSSKVLGGKTSMIAAVQADNIDDSKRLDDKAYSELQQPVSAADIPFVSKPGVFGWNKIDRGSEFLVAHLPEVLARIKTDVKQVADLGCGYGYLSVMASQLLDAAAVACCQQNFLQQGVRGEVSLDSCGDKLSPGFDLLLCNPPFHQGFDVESGLTDSFVRSASRLLKKGGHAFFVVNAFIPLERKAKGLFEYVTVVADNPSFKLLLLRK